MTPRKVYNKLRRIYYGFFMANPRFWYQRHLVEADAIICKAMSEARSEL